MHTDPLKALALKLQAETPDVSPYDISMAALDEAVYAGIISEDEIDLAHSQVMMYLTGSRR